MSAGTRVGKSVERTSVLTACSASFFKIIFNNFLDTLIQKSFFYIMIINNVRGDLADVSARKEVLMAWEAVRCSTVTLSPFLQPEESTAAACAGAGLGRG